MRLSHAPLLAFFVLCFSATALCWRDVPDTSYNNYPHPQSSDRYGDNGNIPPPRINTVYDNPEKAPVSDSWNYDNYPASQFNYEESERVYGDMGVGQKCTKELHVSVDKIIDIQTSVQYGAQLLDGIYAASFDTCIESCCQYEGCDLALFKTDGMSQTGKTCYFVHCGLPGHCRMVSNDGFRAGFLVERQPDSYGDALDSSDFSKPYRLPQEESSQTTPTTQATTPPTTETTSPETTPPEATPSETVHSVTTVATTTQQQVSVVTDSEATERPDSMSTTTSSHSTSAPTTEVCHTHVHVYITMLTCTCTCIYVCIS